MPVAEEGRSNRPALPRKAREEAHTDSRKFFPNGDTLLDKQTVPPITEAVIIFENHNKFNSIAPAPDPRWFDFPGSADSACRTITSYRRNNGPRE